MGTSPCRSCPGSRSRSAVTSRRGPLRPRLRVRRPVRRFVQTGPKGPFWDHGAYRGPPPVAFSPLFPAARSIAIGSRLGPERSFSVCSPTRAVAAGTKKPPFSGGFPKRLKGFEPSTFCMASRRSSQLSYSRVYSFVAFRCGFLGLHRVTWGEQHIARIALCAHSCPIKSRVEGFKIAARQLLAPLGRPLVDAEREASVFVAHLFGDVDRVVAKRGTQARIGAAQRVRARCCQWARCRPPSG